MKAHSKTALASPPQGLNTARRAVLKLAGATLTVPAWAQTFPDLPISDAQRATAQQVAQAGVPLSELAPDAPDSYLVKRGDTLWGISGIFLVSPWRWPELWGMNMDQVRNPHLIYPGQQLLLDKINGMARLRLAQGEGPDGRPIDTIRVSPRTRIQSLGDLALPTLQPHLIEPFLAEPIIVDEGVLERAPRIVAAPESRVLITRGDRAYVRGVEQAPLLQAQPGRAEEFRVFRKARPVRDPVTRKVLGYEAQYLGRALLVRGQSVQPVRTGGGTRPLPVPATVDIVAAREEMRAGDRLLPEPPRQLVSYAPRAPQGPVDGAVAAMYGDSVAMAGQNQVVVINKGTADGIESGHVLAILKDGAQFQDRSQPGERQQIKLPDERNGLMMVFRPFERLSYALILEIRDGVEVGDRVVNPR
ncbi:LysM peptidoglycan-binding domain-containing protein [Ramlibacter tataouinensis]|uniref:LysM domain-containing protein n=1 Tax=Ramlibacter tataouinensis (strain ATCC BAA-407 / DSM 14655 / LMG 21543 / TTB310) TaxID=365046 RepID=F5Y240_RAMTT|nr:LysM domain-containing protein [Ramlibacter tataouinensis]AEG94808.1 Conserved hypothetical protein [Ramlibacter tataouinensis TTB310]